jgi:hypothetical protein
MPKSQQVLGSILVSSDTVEAADEAVLNTVHKNPTVNCARGSRRAREGGGRRAAEGTQAATLGEAGRRDGRRLQPSRLQVPLFFTNNIALNQSHQFLETSVVLSHHSQVIGSNSRCFRIFLVYLYFILAITVIFGSAHK